QLGISVLTFSSKSPSRRLQIGVHYATVRRPWTRLDLRTIPMISLKWLFHFAPRRRVAAFAALAALLLVLPAVSGCSKDSASKQEAPAADDPVVARVNGIEIRQSDLAFAEEDM